MRILSIAVCLLLGMLVSEVSNAAPKPKPALQEFTLTGTLEKKERKTKSGKTLVSYVLTTVDVGRVTLPKSRGKKAPNLDDYSGQQVNVTGKGTEGMRGGKKRVRLTKLTTIEKVQDNAAENDMPVDDAIDVDVDLGDVK